MPWLTLSLLLLFTIPLCIGQVTDAPPAHSVSGQVIDSVTEQPIPRALVQLGQRAVLTDHDGRFEFAEPGEAPLVAFAEKPGYFFESSGAMLQPGGDASLRLTPEAILYGTATDANGQSIQQLQIHLRMQQVRNGRWQWQEIQVTATNLEGEFRFASLRAGKYSLSTGFHEEGLPEASSSAFVPIAYPPVGTEGAPGAITVRPGDHVQADLNPPAEKLYPVTGFVKGAPAPGVGFQVETKDGLTFSPGVFFSPTGLFRMRLPGGSYRLKAQSIVESGEFMGTREISVGQGPLEGLSITLAPEPGIPVEVEYQEIDRQEQTGPPTSLNVWLDKIDPASSGGSLRAETMNSAGAPRPPQPGDPMIIKRVEPGRYVLQAQPQPHWYVASATCGDLDLIRDPLVIAEGAGVCTLRIVLRNDPASLNWSVAPQSVAPQDANGTIPAGTRASVVAIPLENIAQPMLTSGFQIPDDGAPVQGSFDGLPPGRYLLMAIPNPAEALPYRDPEVLEGYRRLGQEVNVTSNGKSDVQLHLAPGEP